NDENVGRLSGYTSADTRGPIPAAMTNHLKKPSRSFRFAQMRKLPDDSSVREDRVIHLGIHDLLNVGAEVECAIWRVACGNKLQIRIADERKCRQTPADQLTLAVLRRSRQDQSWRLFVGHVGEKPIGLGSHLPVKPTVSILWEGSLRERAQLSPSPRAGDLLNRQIAGPWLCECGVSSPSIA